MSAPRKPKSPDGEYPLTLRHVPGETMIGLEALADAEGRSAEAQALYILREAVRRRAGRLAAS